MLKRKKMMRRSLTIETMLSLRQNFLEATLNRIIYMLITVLNLFGLSMVAAVLEE
jgi:hypothetical protein